MSRDIPEMSNEGAELFDSPEDAEIAHYLMDQIENQLEAKEILCARLKATEHQRRESNAYALKMRKQRNKLLSACRMAYTRACNLDDGDPELNIAAVRGFLRGALEYVEEDNNE